jgi:pilus assembly protein Flp/PilA
MKLDPEERIIAAAVDQAVLNQANERGAGARIGNFRVTGTPGCLTIGLASHRAGSITDQPPIIPRPAPRTRNNQSGVTAIEYALIAALIAVAAIAAFTLVGTNLSTTFSTIAAKL